MKNKFFRKILILSLIIFSIAPVCFAQNSPQPAQNTEIMGEGDRLPFMQNQQSERMEEPGSGGLLIKTLGAMFLIVGLIFGGAWCAKKFGFGNFKANDAADDINLAVLSTVSLGNGRTISTVRFGEKVLLVGSTAQSIALLAEESKPEETSLLQTRSVAEMLDEEIIPFEAEFEKANARLDFENGGQI